MSPSAPPIGSLDAAAQRGRWHRLRWPLATLAAVLGGCAALALRDPNEPGSWLFCPFLVTTGHACPGCGGLRAVHALTQGDAVAAAQHNPLLLLAAPVLVFAWLAAVRRAWLGVPGSWVPGLRTMQTVAWLIGVFWLARNAPGVTWLGPNV